MITATIADAEGNPLAEDAFTELTEAMRWAEGEFPNVHGAVQVSYTTTPTQALDKRRAELARDLVDSDYHWHYRIIGYGAIGGAGVTGSLVVDECENPPTAGDLRRIDAAHDAVMSLPSTRDAMTVGPMRTRLKA